MTVALRRYRAEDDRTYWDDFVRASKNGTFLFLRGFMDYHADRFDDRSLVAEDDGRIVALLPANLADGVLHSHQGLTYGGWITGAATSATHLLQAFERLPALAAALGARELVYKCVPRIYHRLPADEDLYALFRVGAKLFRRDLSTVIELAGNVAVSSSRKKNLVKARKHRVTVAESPRLDAFHALLSATLAARHGAKPVHTLAELELLAGRFPSNIRLFAAFDGESGGEGGGGDMLAGALVFDAGPTVHTQYLASSPAGRERGALDAVIEQLRTVEYRERRFLSFGISTEDGGLTVNDGLLFQKEGFGGRAIVHDFYSLAFDEAPVRAPTTDTR